MLGERDQFENYYRQQRKEQAKVLLRAPTKMTSSLESHLKFFYEVIGFGCRSVW